MVRSLLQTAWVVLLCTMLCACEKQTRYEVLTFFFTGVPPLEEEEESEEEKIEENAAVQPVVEKTVDPTKRYFSHPIWAAGICDPCHQSSATFNIPGIAPGRKPVFKSGGGMPGALTMAPEKICIQCHRDKTPKRAISENIWLHNTVAKGDCLACHDPHQGQFEKTLRHSPSSICLPCHKEGKYLTTPAHRTGQDCLQCHNAHLGKDRNLLTADFKEEQRPVENVPGHPEFTP